LQIRVDAGSNTPYADSLGKSWVADLAYTSGSYGYTQGGVVFNASDTVIGTADPALYQTLRQGRVLEYRFDLPMGSYQVTLKLCDFLSTQAGQRSVVVKANGSRVAGPLDLSALVGQDAAYDLNFTASPSQGSLVVRLEGVKGAATLSAIQVVGLQSLSANPTPTPNLHPFDFILIQPADASFLQ
jgi:chitinase